MVVYTYRCAKGHTFDSLQYMPGQPQKQCPICGRIGERQIKAVGFILKGDGWERDGYGLRDGKKKW